MIYVIHSVRVANDTDSTTLFFNLDATIPVAIPELTPTAKKSFLKIFYKQIVPINWLSFLKVISQ